MYQLKQGSIFDQKCDIVVIPCNNYGEMTYSVTKDLISYGLPTLIKISDSEKIIFEVCPKNFAISSIIAYAVSVELTQINKSFTYNILYNICNQIIDYCNRNSLRFVNIPLLGSSSGGLSHKESFDIIKECFYKEHYIEAKIFTPYENIYNMLNKTNTFSEINNEIHPRVFISYTGYDKANQKWVKGLCTKLRQNGVDARCDIFHLKLGQDLPQWMTNEICLADKVLLICDKYYLSKLDSHRGGVSWETMIIQGDMLMNQDSDKYICIVRTDNVELSLPTYMRTKYSLWCTENEIEKDTFKQLLLNLFNCSEIPPISSIPQYIKDAIIK